MLLKRPALLLADCPIFTVSTSTLLIGDATSTLFICSLVLIEFAVLTPCFILVDEWSRDEAQEESLPFPLACPRMILSVRFMSSKLLLQAVITDSISDEMGAFFAGGCGTLIST
jgi:hypothetical protein